MQQISEEFTHDNLTPSTLGSKMGISAHVNPATHTLLKMMTAMQRSKNPHITMRDVIGQVLEKYVPGEYTDLSKQELEGLLGRQPDEQDQRG